MEGPDPSRVNTMEDLARCLLQLHIRADKPSLRALEQRTGKAAGSPLADGTLRSVRLGRSSLHYVLHGRTFPKKAFLLTFVEACGIDLAADHRWEDAWNRLAAQNAENTAPQETNPRQQIRQDRVRAERAAEGIEQLRRQLGQIRARAERAEKGNEQLRRQLVQVQAQADRTEKENEQLRWRLGQVQARAERAEKENEQFLQQTFLAIASTQTGAAAAGQVAETPRTGSDRPAAKRPPTSESLRRWDPERIGPYVVLGRLGSGSMGQVYLGRSAAGRLVAVKTIRVELAEEAGFRTRFAQEVAAARKVSGVFTAAVVEADPEADLPWLATAYVPAPSLSRLVLACGPLPVSTVRWLAAGCAEALASIHGAGLVHRDLKPSNVLVAPDGPRVIDFGVARAAERMGRTTTRGVVGTPAYMAPEQARDTREASVASDVYSLGATLLFAATGHPPYAGTSVMDVLARLASEGPDLDGLPGELSGLVAGCLDRVPRARPTSSAMLVQLGDFTVAQAGPDDEHSYLPEAAMAMIAEYQRSPQFAARTGSEEENPTSASYTELPASYRPARRASTDAGVDHKQSRSVRFFKSLTGR
jgi:serine/threonine protein kinase